MRIGKVKELYRYPVKSMAGERLLEAPIYNHGVLYDRSYALKTNSKYVTANRYPELLKYKAKMIQENLSITSPEGVAYSWEDSELIESISRQTRIGELERVYNDPLTNRGAYWEDHILFVSSSSIVKISDLCGVGLLDLRRFRPNIVVELDSHIPFEEDQWIGKNIAINNTLFSVNDNSIRCAYINIDPSNPVIKQPSILKTVVKERKNKLGVYASVINQGTIYEGSEVLLYEKDH